MSTNQELIEQNIRILLGDLQLQLVFAKAQIATLEQLYADAMAKVKVSEVVESDERRRAESLMETLDKYQTAEKMNGAGIPAG